MSNIIGLENINSVCTTPEELIKSPDFIRGVTIILEKVGKFNKDYILSLFIKLQNSETLDDEEKGDLKDFVSNSKVSILGQELLSKLSNVSLNVKTNNTAELIKFSELLNSIFKEDGFKKVQSYIGEVSSITELTLNKYEGMVKIKVKYALEEKEIYMDKEYLKIDSSNWEEKEIDGVKVKINPEGDITEFLEGELSGEQLFTGNAAMRESEKQGKRLPNIDEEMDAIILAIQKEDNKIFPGYRNSDGSTFNSRCTNALLWSSTPSSTDAFRRYLNWNNSTVFRYANSQAYGFSVRCIKD